MQRSYRLCGKDDKYHSRTCKAVKQKAVEHMDTVNANAAPVNDPTVAALWEKTYLLFAEENLRASPIFRQLPVLQKIDGWISGHAFLHRRD